MRMSLAAMVACMFAVNSLSTGASALKEDLAASLTHEDDADSDIHRSSTSPSDLDDEEPENNDEFDEEEIARQNDPEWQEWRANTDIEYIPPSMADEEYDEYIEADAL
ncbi:hypothetical protein LEN26_016865 [Aphanomyces euteiches]|nr:hypothetical protein LEN26_016865 [Aphanomyces euteiches]KAH9105398.1 hypothetical protein AeMF1_018767 [Aphanomyces euteiches]KAH9181986.1 hypothetical protein AeNC1_016040 [Aphanomyces euteiches]